MKDGGRDLPASALQAEQADGVVLWTPSPEQVARANVTHFTRWLAAERGLTFGGYQVLCWWFAAVAGAVTGAIAR